MNDQHRPLRRQQSLGRVAAPIVPFVTARLGPVTPSHPPFFYTHTRPVFCRNGRALRLPAILVCFTTPLTRSSAPQRVLFDSYPFPRRHGAAINTLPGRGRRERSNFMRAIAAAKHQAAMSHAWIVSTTAFLTSRWRSFFVCGGLSAAHTATPINAARAVWR
ncbi:MAG: hypothetical protein HC828_03340 [Blastochloris sp.]|nr:hypothetical protein [Blastochloris sp.]